MAKDALREVNAHNVDAINNVAFMPKEESKEETFFAEGGHVETKKSKDKLEVANKYNLQKFNKKENLFFVGGSSRINYADSLFYGNTPEDSSRAGSVGAIMSYNKQRNLDMPPNTLNWDDLYSTQPSLSMQPLSTTTPQPKVVVVNQTAPQVQTNNNSTNGSSSASNIDNAKNAVTQTALFGSDASKWDKLALQANAKDATWFDGSSKLSMTDQYKQSKGGLFNMSKEANPFSKGNIGGTMKGIGAAAAAMGTQIGKSDANPRGMFDVLDPVHALAGGRESAVGNAMSDAGVGVFQAGAQTGQPYLMIAGAALKVLGGLSNAAFGIKENKEMKKAADQSIATNSNFLSNASSFDAIKGPGAMSNTNVYEGGWFSGGKADEKNAELTRKMADAYSWADRSVANNMRNLSEDQINNFLRNYSAFGGYLTRPKHRRKIKR